MKKILPTIFAILALTLAGCSGVRQADRELWIGKPASLLNKHRFFSRMKKQVFAGSNGISTWVFRSRGHVNVPLYCYSSIGYFGVTTCSGGTRYVECDHEFEVKRNIILSYNPTGNCYTDKRTWPSNVYR